MRRHGFVSITWNDASAGGWDCAVAVLQSGGSWGGDGLDSSSLDWGVVGGLNRFSGVGRSRDSVSAGAQSNASAGGWDCFGSA